MCRDSRAAFVGEINGQSGLFRKLRTESARVLRAFALAAIHVARQTDNDLLGAALFGKLRYTLQKALAVVLVHDLYGTCEQLAFIAYGNARTRFAEVYT